MSFSPCHCRVVSSSPIWPRVFPRLLRHHCHRLHTGLPPRKYPRWHPSRCQRRHRYLLLPLPRPHPSYTFQSKKSPCRHLKKFLMTIHSSYAIPLPRLSSLSLRPRLHKLDPVHRAQPYHHLHLHRSHILLLRQRAGSSGAPHLLTFKRRSHNPHLHLDMPPHTPTPRPQSHPALPWTHMACLTSLRPVGHYTWQLRRKCPRQYT